MESKFGYEFSRNANIDLDNIISYIAVELENPKAAKDFLDRLEKIIQEIRVFPESGSIVANEFLYRQDVRKKVVDNYIMYYLPDFSKKTIYILRIIYGKRNINEILKELN